MFKKILFSIFVSLFLVSNVFAHSGKLDKYGGHKVTKQYTYEGRYIVIKKGIKHYESGKIVFKAGGYHYHVHPRANGYRDGIYIPVKDTNEVGI